MPYIANFRIPERADFRPPPLWSQYNVAITTGTLALNNKIRYVNKLR
jgi:hypothetical protein